MGCSSDRWHLVYFSGFCVLGSCGEGKLNTPTGGGRTAYLNSVSSDNTDLLASMGVDKTATGGGLYVTVAGRVVPGAGEYRAKIKFRSDGKPSLGLIRTSAAGIDTTLRPRRLLGHCRTRRRQDQAPATGHWNWNHHHSREDLEGN